MSIARNTAAYWLSQIGNFAFSFIVSIFVARCLGPEHRGVLVGVLLANSLALSLTNMGLQQIGMFFVGKNPERVVRHHALLALMAFLLWVFDFLVFVCWGEFFRHRVFHDLDMGYLILSFVVLLASLYNYEAQGILTGLGRIKMLSACLFGISFITNSANLAVLGLWRGNPEMQLKTLILVWTISQFAGGGLLAFAIFRSSIMRKGKDDADVTPRTQTNSDRQSGEHVAPATNLKDMVSFGSRAFVGNVASIAVNKADQLFVLSGVGAIGLGIYGIAIRLAELIFYASASFENAAYSRIAKAGRDEAARLVQDIFRANFVLDVIAAGIMMICARPFVAWVYGEEYADAVAPLVILLPGTLCFSASRMLALYFTAQLGKPQIPSAIAWGIAVIYVPMLWWFVSREKGGMVAAAWVSTACYGAMLVCYLAIFASATGLRNPMDYFAPRRRDVERLKSLLSPVRSQDRPN